jgi:SAM-dependent methyltransferase
VPATTPPLLPLLAAPEATTTSAAPLEYDLSYRDAFWPGREYEDRCDRLALRALLPPGGRRLLDLGAGFGRLVDEYDAFDGVTLVDASDAMLDAARARLVGDPRITFVAADATDLPFPDATFDTVVAVRLLVHLRDPGPLFREVRRVLRPSGRFIVEYPNRRHLLAAVRHLCGRQRWSPTGLAAHEYLDDHFAHQPARVARQLRRAGLEPEAIRAVSLFRSAALKERVPLHLLIALEARLQQPLGRLVPGPSVFVCARVADGAPIGRIQAASVPK